MQNQFGSLDGYKLSWLLQEAIEKFRFVACINKEDETSSELAGYEINKLLNEEINLEERYAELLKVRGTLKGISNKRKLEEIQKEVEEVAHALKESTKKLGRLFRENPDLKKEAEKVANERIHLVTKTMSVFSSLQLATPTFTPCQAELIAELDDQDSLRQRILKEKGLLSDIKQLHALLKNEEQAYQNEVQEKQANVQTRKESLEKGRTDAEIEVTNLKAEVDADKGTKKRLFDLRITNLDQQIEKIKERKAVETQVFHKIAVFLKEKENQKKEEIQEWSTKLEETRAKKEDEISRLNDLKTKAQDDLKKLKEEYESRNGMRLEKEEKQLERDADKKLRREEEEKLDEAVKKIQENYRAWKEAGGVVKKPKKGKKKAAKK
jgi:hypothetical protein